MMETDKREYETSLAKARDGDHYEMIKVAIHLYNGDGVDKDLSAASYWLEKAQESQDPYLLCLLGEYYEFGIVFGKDLSKAEALYRKARDISRLFSYMLGRLHHIQQAGSSKYSLESAMKFYLESARLFHIPSIAGIFSILRENYAGLLGRIFAILLFPLGVVFISILYLLARNSYLFWKAEDFSSRMKQKEEKGT